MGCVNFQKFMTRTRWGYGKNVSIFFVLYVCIYLAYFLQYTLSVAVLTTSLEHTQKSHHKGVNWLFSLVRTSSGATSLGASN